MPPTSWTEASAKADGNYAVPDYVEVDYWEDLDEDHAAAISTTWIEENAL